MVKICIYLRKSRADEEIERDLGEGETLARHRKALLKYAKDKGLDIVNVREEVVSGESLIHRPQMLELLKEVESGLYDAVLVMDMQRLGRGGMQDQGLILKTFKESNTKIITPQKTYDLNNEWDEEYTEFEAFMSRKELKMITRRMQGGRVRSVEEGNYIGTRPPYGYLIEEDKHSRYLIPHPDQSSIVRLIFDLYVNKSMGANNVAIELNKLGYTSYTGLKWASASVLNIIKNPVYIGIITWRKKKSKKSEIPGKRREVKLQDKDKWITSKGKHEPIVDESIFVKAQEILDKKYHVPYQIVNGQRNPFAGIIICGLCGGKMMYRPVTNKEPRILCYKNCGNVSTKFKHVEDRIIDDIKEYIKEKQLSPRKQVKNNNIETYKKALYGLEQQLEELKKQKINIHDLLEKGVYNIDTFLDRSKYTTEKIEETETKISEAMYTIEQEEKAINANEKLLPNLKKLITLYYKAKTPNDQYELVKNVIDKVVYSRSKEQKETEFELQVIYKINYIGI